MTFSIRRAERACSCLKGIAHPTRLAILVALRQGPRSVNELVADVASASQSNISQHLSQMRACGLVAARREGAQVFYEAANRKVFQFLDLLGEIFCG